MRQYACLKKNEFELGQYKIVPLRHEDILKIKDWRNGQMEILRQKSEITEEQQIAYFDKVVWPLFEMSQPTQLLFSYLKDEELIGYGGLVYIDWLDQRAEVSFLVDTVRALDSSIYQKDFETYLNLIKQVAFEGMKFNRIFTETFDIRGHHISVLEASGFVKEGCMKQHININNKFIDSIIHGYLKEYYHA